MPVLVNPSRFAAGAPSDPHIGIPTRLYFATSGAPAATPSFNAGWNITSSAAVRPLYLAGELGTGAAGPDSNLAETSASVVNRLKRQHVSQSTVGTSRTIQGTISLAVTASESASGAAFYLQVIAYVTSGNGATVRGVLYAGQTANTVSSTQGDNNEEWFPGSSRTRIMTDSISPVAAQAGDRVVVEIGYRACNTVTTSYTGAFALNDKAADGDLAFTSGGGGGPRPWVEFNYELFAN